MLRALVLVYLSAAIIAGTVAIQSGQAFTGLMTQATSLLHPALK